MRFIRKCISVPEELDNKVNSYVERNILKGMNYSSFIREAVVYYLKLRTGLKYFKNEADKRDQKRI